MAGWRLSPASVSPRPSCLVACRYPWQVLRSEGRGLEDARMKLMRGDPTWLELRSHPRQVHSMATTHRRRDTKQNRGVPACDGWLPASGGATQCCCSRRTKIPRSRGRRWVKLAAFFVTNKPHLLVRTAASPICFPELPVPGVRPQERRRLHISLKPKDEKKSERPEVCDPYVLGQPCSAAIAPLPAALLPSATSNTSLDLGSYLSNLFLFND